jgi:FkbM family methyltransferase
MESLSPIVLFVYNRPWHTHQTLEALLQNELADESILYIYSDGPKENDKEDEQKIAAVRNVIRSKQWCKEVRIIESDLNLGLANSIIKGVTEVVNEYGKIIVLEDDIVTSKGFLTYMNTALDLYEKEEKVFHISGYMFPVKGKLPTTFFYKQTSCWGWGTWAGKWNYFEPSANELLKQLIDTKKIETADIDGTNQFLNQLKANIEGKLRTWAVLWHFSVFLNDGLSLHPGKPLIKNIGNDGSGSHCQETKSFDVNPAVYVPVKRIKVEEWKKVYQYLEKFYNPNPPSVSLLSLKQKIKSIVPSKIKQPIKRVTRKTLYESEMEAMNLKKIKDLEVVRIQNLPRFFETEISLLDKNIRIVDIASFQFMKKEIFDGEIYKFSTDTDCPYIIDCGANIGLSVIYFKQLYPEAEIIAFEPDRKVFNALQNNIEVFNLKKTNLINKACWSEETVLQFYSEGADSGRVTSNKNQDNIIEVETVELKNYLNRNVNFLKIDIEGAENEVIRNIKEALINVERIFVEFHSFVEREQMLPELLGILKDAGFRLHISSPGLVSKNPFIHLKTYAGMDNQLNIYGYR